ncbi:caspase family protein [Pseudogemmobacter humi]|uniref:Caspase domain protein n=1 Tax=Pseudogemmobacter humi TaxID=2483812 RepID=A0A3P5WV35_9RHOB|nr:caspase family protein [Pseudogemmobacter humi]VDC25232.1 Caspase domain protein [Pseudogemmobacter humi]
MKPALAYALMTTAFMAAAPARAEVHALLIGVGDYAVLDADLQGPPHDARLMAETLTARGVAPGAITVLSTDPTDLPEGAATGLPTREGILAALDSLASTATPGDTVVFYFSGHGAQAPDLSGDEGGGYDEIFLPMDASGWKGEIGMVENAIIDDELQAWAQTLLTNGVQLVGVIDACHSATGFRALDQGHGVARSLAPDLLGIPEDAAPAPFTGANELTGDFVFLYSSQSDERSFEYPLGDTGIWHGEFTLRLAQVLAAAPEASWAQVLAAASDAMVQGPARQIPEGEGPLLTAGVFGEGTGTARLRVGDGALRAGLLQGLAEGAEIALYAEGAGGEPLGTARLGKVSAREAAIEGALPEGAAWAELIALPPPEPLALAAPVRADLADGEDYTAWLAALDGAGAARPDFVPVLTDGGLVLAGPDGVLDPQGPGSSLRVLPGPDETEAAALARVLDTAAHGLRLAGVLSAAAGRGLTKTEVIRVEIERRPGAQSGDGCTGKTGPGEAYDPALGVSGCDQLWLTLTNASGKAQDVSVLYLDTGFAVQPIWPGDNMVNRLAPGESARVGMRIDPVHAAGTEEIWVLAVPMADARAPRADLTTLASPGVNRNLPGGAENPVTLWLDAQITPPDADTADLRGFSLKPADLTMIRRIVRLNPGAA